MLILGGIGIAVLFFYIGNILGYNAGWEDGFDDAAHDLSVGEDDE